MRFHCCKELAIFEMGNKINIKFYELLDVKIENKKVTIHFRMKKFLKRYLK